MTDLYDKHYRLDRIAELPEVPGVYFFLGAKKEILYIGKATSLRDRVKSYFSRDISETRGPKIVLMLEKACSVAYRQADSVLEALILETNLIKEHQPPYNTDQKDDKSYNHVVITDEKFPRVLVVRGRDIAQGKFTESVKYVFGPFPSGGGLKEAMKIVRRLFPYRDKCSPANNEQGTKNNEQGTRSKEHGTTSTEQGSGNGEQGTGNRDLRPCFNRQIGLCPGVCTGEISAKEYGWTINRIRLFFEGRKGMLVKRLEREMKAAAKALAFERAGEIKKTLFGLRHIQDMALIKDEVRDKRYEIRDGMRIEAYDVAHLMGEASVGVMTVVENGQKDTDGYRQFKLRGGHRGDDLRALEEILTRRMKHPEWGVPDVVVVDGSFLQLGVAEKLFEGADTAPLLVGVVKDDRHKAKRIIGLPDGFAHLYDDILLANSEAHRFAIAFHRKRRGKEFLR